MFRFPFMAAAALSLFSPPAIGVIDVRVPEAPRSRPVRSTQAFQGAIRLNRSRKWPEARTYAEARAMSPSNDSVR